MLLTFDGRIPDVPATKNYCFRRMNDVSANRGASVFVSFLSLSLLLLTLNEFKDEKEPLGKRNLPVIAIRRKKKSVQNNKRIYTLRRQVLFP